VPFVCAQGERQSKKRTDSLNLLLEDIQGEGRKKLGGVVNFRKGGGDLALRKKPKKNKDARYGLPSGPKKKPLLVLAYLLLKAPRKKKAPAGKWISPRGIGEVTMVAPESTYEEIGGTLLKKPPRGESFEKGDKAIKVGRHSFVGRKKRERKSL